jgi:hypothetical protein
MEDFECSTNQLVELPDGLVKWTKLTYLNLSSILELFDFFDLRFLIDYQ